MAPRRRALTELFERGRADERGPGPGTVFDIGYQRYTGTREGRGRARRAVFKDGLRTALGLGRGGRAKILPWFFIALLSAIGHHHGAGGRRRRAVGRAGHRRQGQPPVARRLLRDRLDHPFRVRGPGGARAPLPRPEGRARSTSTWSGPSPARTTSAPRWLAFLAVMIGAAWLPQLILLVGLSDGRSAPVLSPATLARRPQVSPGRRGDGGLCHHPGAPDRVVHHPAGVRGRLPGRPLHHHHAVHRRALPGDRGQLGSGSRSSTSPTSRCT